MSGALEANGFIQKLLSMIGLCFVLVMVALDQTVVGTALPAVVAELKGFELYAWVGTAYLLTSVIAVPIFGKLGDEHGRKPFVLLAIVLFTLASALCGFAASMRQLVWARALQGVGGGMLIAAAFASIPDMFPVARDRLRWQVLFSASFGLANAVGPWLGGFLTEYVGWRWVFFVNLPVGALGLWFVWRYLPMIRHGEHPPQPLDWLGALLVALTLGSLQLLVEWLPTHKPVALILAMAVVVLIAGSLLVWWERRSPNPVLPLAMLMQRDLQPMFVLSLMLGFCMFAVMYYAPLLFQGGFGLTPHQAGLLVTPLAVSIPLGSMINGRIVGRVRRPKVMLYVGMGLFCLAAVALAWSTAETPHGSIVAIMMMAGAGLGLVLPNLTLFTQHCAPKRQLGVATAMLQSSRMIGGMLGMALVGALVTHSYVHGVNRVLQAGGRADLRGWLDDPQILVDPVLAERFAAALPHGGEDAALLIAQARDLLVEALHRSDWLIALLVLLAVSVIRRVPAVDLRRPAKAREGSHD